MNICVVGSGYVGLVTGAVFADLGNDVVCVDNVAEKVEALKAGHIPIYDQIVWLRAPSPVNPNPWDLRRLRLDGERAARRGGSRSGSGGTLGGSSLGR